MRFDADEEKLRDMRSTKGKTAMECISNWGIKASFKNLWNCARDGDVNNLKRLLILGANPNMATRKKKLTPLHIVRNFP